MLATREIEQKHKAELSPVEIIYQAGIDRDETRINSVLSVTSIDAQDSADGTAASKLAFEGRHDAVHFLRTRFNASLLWIMFGYARGGYVNEVNELLKFAVISPSQQLELFRNMVSGYALGGYVDAAAEVLKFATTSADRLILLQDMACGCARGGHVNTPEEVLKHVATSVSVDPLALSEHMAFGYARAGDVDAANKMLDLAPLADRRSFLGTMGGGYARSGYVGAVNKMLKLVPIADQFHVLLEVVYGYALSGHINPANDVLKLVETSADRFALLQDMVSGYVRGGYLKAANDALKLAETPVDRVVLLTIIVDNINTTPFSNERTSLQTLAIFSSNFQPVIASELKDFQETLTPLVPKAQKLRRVMHSRKLNFNQAMGWIQPEMRIWLLQGVQLVTNNQLTSAIFLSICRYLTPGSASEMIDLSNRLRSTLCRGRFFTNPAAPPKNSSAVLDTKKPKPK